MVNKYYRNSKRQMNAFSVFRYQHTLRLLCRWTASRSSIPDNFRYSVG